MHILYHGTIEETLLSDGYAQNLFISESVKMAAHFDSAESKAKIPTFVKQSKLACLIWQNQMSPSTSASTTFLRVE